MIDWEKVIQELEFIKEMILFDPSTWECKEPENLNDLDKITYYACICAIDLLKENDQLFSMYGIQGGANNGKIV